MAQPNLNIIDLDSDEEEIENGLQENCHRTESPEIPVLVITEQGDTQQRSILENANKKEELVRGSNYGKSEKGKELQLEPEHLVERKRQNPERMMITEQGETQQHSSLENGNKKGIAPQYMYWESEKQLQVNPQLLAEKGGQPQRPKPWNPDKGTKHWNDKYDKKKLPWGQRQKSSEQIYERQKQEVTEKVTLTFRFDKGQTRCYNKNSNLSKKVTKLQSEYL